MGQRQPHEASVFRLAERLPFQEFELLERLGQLQRLFELGELIQAEHRRMDAGHEGGEGRRRHLRDGPQSGHVVDGVFRRGTRPNLIVAQQQAERLAAGRAELVAVDFAEQLALIELDGPFEVAGKLVPSDAQQADFDVLRPFGLFGQILQPAPGGLQFLEPRVVQNGVHAVGEQAVQVGHVAAQETDDLILGEARRAPPGEGQPPRQRLLQGWRAEEVVQACPGRAVYGSGGLDDRVDPPARRRRRHIASRNGRYFGRRGKVRIGLDGFSTHGQYRK